MHNNASDETDSKARITDSAERSKKGRKNGEKKATKRTIVFVSAIFTRAFKQLIQRISFAGALFYPLFELERQHMFDTASTHTLYKSTCKRCYSISFFF